jgi:hypothetical protein
MSSLCDLNYVRTLKTSVGLLWGSLPLISPFVHFALKQFSHSLKQLKSWFCVWSIFVICHVFRLKNNLSTKFHLITPRCGYTQRSQEDYKRIVNLFWSFFHFFHMKVFLNEIFCNLLLKIHIAAPIDYMFCVNHLYNVKFSKCVDFAKICILFWNFIIILNNTKIC